ncbi:MAG: DUF354 domain-containing protein [Pseudomonadota bacterium]
MRILVDIVHPADVLFFRHPIAMLQEAGHEVFVLSRQKDVTGALLDGFEIPHRSGSSAARGLFGLGLELLIRDVAMIRAARRFKPDVITGFGGVAAAHAGRALSIPSVVFYDSDNARLQTRITWPFVSRLYVPEGYIGSVPEGRTERIPGTKELSYFHPSRFRFEPDRAAGAGLVSDRPNVLLRLVANNASHDIGNRGWDLSAIEETIGGFGDRTKFHVSMEGEAPPGLTSALYSGTVTEIHQLMAGCRVVAGDSASMAAEAAIMGVPAVYAGPDIPGYMQELADNGLITIVPPGDVSALAAAIRTGLSRPEEEARARRDAYMHEKPDWSRVIVSALTEIR